MPVLRIQDFSGVVPVKGDRAIPDGFADDVGQHLAVRLRAARHPPAGRPDRLPVDDAPGAAHSEAHGRRRPGLPRRIIPPPSYLGDSVWVQFTDHDTDIVKGQLVEDQFERYYFCSPTTGPMFNTYARLRDGLPMYKLGVPAGRRRCSRAIHKPTITSITGGAAPVVTRAYIYTWVNVYGEESAPALPVTGAGNANAIWNIGNILDPTDASSPATPTYQKKWLYRTITGASGQTTYYRVAEIAAGTTTYADDTRDDRRRAGQQSEAGVAPAGSRRRRR